MAAATKRHSAFSRRHFLLGGLGITGALVVGWCLLPPRQRLHAGSPTTAADRIALNGWVAISPEGVVAVTLAKSEMGQGVTTSLPMLVAEELDVPLSSVVVTNASIDAIYGDTTMMADGLPFHPDDQGLARRVAQWLSVKASRELGVMATGGSSSIKDGWPVLRAAGAAARARLMAAAASAWGVPVAECRTESGEVIHPSGRRAAYGTLVRSAAALDDVPYTLKPASAFRLIGRDVAALDAPDKINGRAQFGLDVKLPGLLHAALAMCPTFGGQLAGFDPQSVAGLPGVVRVVPLQEDRSGAPVAVAVVAKTYWQARKALAAFSVRWQPPPSPVSDAAVFDQLREQLRNDEGFTYYRRGDAAPSEATSGTERTITAEYRAPFLAHAPMEPINCTALWRDGVLQLWVPTQVPSVAVSAAARVAGIGKDAVRLNTTLLGGGFGRRLETDMVVQATQLALACAGQPVRLLWTREDDLAHDFYRPAALAQLSAVLGPDARVLRLNSHSASPAPVQRMLARAFGLPAAGPDKSTVEGLYDHAYEIPHQRVSHVTIESPVPVGSWRSVGHSHNAFFKESFIDELAYASHQDPVQFRLAMLAGQPRHRAVLEAAVARAGKPADGHAHGVALHRSFGSVVAQVAEVTVSEGRIEVRRIICAIDCGTVVHPDGVRKQMESAIAYGLSAALFGEIGIREGAVVQRNFHDYPMLRMPHMPAIDVVLLPSDAPPEGAGEPGLPPVAPAVANAIFRLTGKRLRALPLRWVG